MFNSTKYINKLLLHLEENLSDIPNDLEVITKYPPNYISYPLASTSVTVSLKKIDFITISADPAGTIEILIEIFTARDRGYSVNRNLVDQVINALLSFDGYDFSGITIGNSVFNRISSAICTSVVASVNFGELPA